MRPTDARDGHEALHVLRQALDEGDPFRMALLSLHMPNMDGETLGRAIKADPRTADIRLALMTTLGGGGKRGHFEEVGFAGCLTKPITNRELKDFLCPSTEDRLRARGGERSLMIPDGAGDELSPDAAINPRVLVAEDNIVNQQVALGILNRLGLRADIAADGSEALRALERIPYDLILMDVQMPVMDGTTTARHIRNPESAVLNHDVPIIATTAHAMHGDREKCLSAGMNDYISKPISRQILVGLLQKWLPGLEFYGQAQERETSKTEERRIWDKAGLMDRLMGDEDLAKEIVEAFLEDIPTQFQVLRECLEREDVRNAERLVHTIKGVSANVGGEGLREAASQLEKALKTGDCCCCSCTHAPAGSGIRVTAGSNAQRVCERGKLL